jgi:hypothetical protein
MSAPNDVAKCIVAYSVPEPNTGCWLWLHGTNAAGYGVIRVGGGRQILAHRAAYGMFIGSIPPNLQICHKCDVPCCVNPAHLYAGTAADNAADKVRRGRQRHGPFPEITGSKHGNAKLTEEIVIEARRRVRLGEFAYNLAGEYGVSRSVMYRAVTGNTWRHVPLTGDCPP